MLPFDVPLEVSMLSLSSIVIPSTARATVASDGFLNSSRANERSFDICPDIQGSGDKTTLSPLSCRLKKFTILSSVAEGGRLWTKSRFDCRALDGFNAALPAEPLGWFMNACNRLGSIGCWRGAPGNGNMPGS